MVFKRLLITCEHASNRLPKDFAALCPPGLLKTHRAYDLGAAKTAARLASRLRSPVLSGSVSRLLVDLNRSARNRNVFSAFSRRLSAETRKKLLDRYHRPYWLKARSHAAQAFRSRGGLLHLSIHSFTPVMKEKKRDCDIGLLFDPGSKAERKFCLCLRRKLRHKTSLRVRFNYPYRGKSDALTTALRRDFQARYAGIEIEINQKIVLGSCRNLEKLETDLFEAIAASLLS